MRRDRDDRHPLRPISGPVGHPARGG
jgi:hypothetical protein